jgi:hypothetical protein
VSLFNAIQQLADATNDPPSPGTRYDDEHHRHSNFHRTIVSVATWFAVVGVGLGLLTSYAFARDAESGSDFRVIVLSPILFGVGGFVFGMAVTCLFTPTAFLTGPIGQPWMRLVGTRNVLVARIACLLRPSRHRSRRPDYFRQAVTGLRPELSDSSSTISPSSGGGFPTFAAYSSRVGTSRSLILFS